MKLSSLLALILVLAAGWMVFHRGEAFPPAIVADEVTGYSVAQRLELANGPPDMTHDYAEDRTFVPAGVSYVRIEYLASVVTKPYPKVYVADAAFPANWWIFETVLTVEPQTMPSVFSATGDLPCAADSGDLNAGLDRVEIRLRHGKGPTQRCLVNKDTGCRYLRALRWLSDGRHKVSGGFPAEALKELQSRMDCPKAFF